MRDLDKQRLAKCDLEESRSVAAFLGKQLKAVRGTGQALREWAAVLGAASHNKSHDRCWSMSVVTLASCERSELERLARSRTRALERAKRRAKVILMLSAGGSYSKISKRLGCSVNYISYWRGRFKQNRLIGLDSRDRGAGRRRNSAQIEARVLEWTRREPTDGSTQWSSRRLAKEVGASQSTVSRVWRKFGIQPPSWPVYMAIDDAGFAEKAADIIGLYIRGPVHAAAFCVDVKSAVRAPDLLDPGFPLSPGYAVGALSLYSALNTQAEEELTPTGARHPSTEFVDFLAQIAMSQPAGRELRVLVTNSSAYKTRKVFQFLEGNPSIRIHYAPTYSNWVHQVERWFSKIHRDVVSRSDLTSVNGLDRKLLRYIRKYKNGATPIRWIY
jgi:transposase